MARPPAFPGHELQVPIEIVFGSGGALALALLWIHDLRKERDELKATIKRFLDKIEPAIRPDR